MRVGVVGEILVKYHPDANNHVVDVIESQDCEAVVPGIMEFMTTRPYITDWNEKNLGMGGNKKLGYALDAHGVSTCYLNPVRAGHRSGAWQVHARTCRCPSWSRRPPR